MFPLRWSKILPAPSKTGALFSEFRRCSKILDYVLSIDSSAMYGYSSSDFHELIPQREITSVYNTYTKNVSLQFNQQRYDYFNLNESSKLCSKFVINGTT